MPKLLTTKIQSLIQRNALFVVNHSGGKDSQAMLIKILEIIPAEQILVVHAHLPEVEWPGVAEHVQRYLQGLEYRQCQARRTLLQMVQERGMFPSPANRQCTSDLKRGPIERTIRQYIREMQLSGLIVNCMGMRAEESPARAKRIPFQFSQRNSKAGREWYEWLPIHDVSTPEVFAIIRNAGQKWHWAYDQGMSRLSCCFCIMASAQDLKTAARLNPELYKTYVELERATGHTLSMPYKGNKVTLEQLTGIYIDQPPVTSQLRLPIEGC